MSSTYLNSGNTYQGADVNLHPRMRCFMFVVEAQIQLTHSFTPVAVYTISGSWGKSSFTIYKRFRNFLELNTLVQEYVKRESLHVELPPLKLSFPLHGYDQQVIRERLGQLQNYLNVVVSISNILETSIITDWIEEDSTLSTLYSLRNPIASGYISVRTSKRGTFCERYVTLHRDGFVAFYEHKSYATAFLVPSVVELSHAKLELYDPLRTTANVPRELEMHAVFDGFAESDGELDDPERIVGHADASGTSSVVDSPPLEYHFAVHGKQKRHGVLFNDNVTVSTLYFSTRSKRIYEYWTRALGNAIMEARGMLDDGKHRHAEKTVIKTDRSAETFTTLPKSTARLVTPSRPSRSGSICDLVTSNTPKALSSRSDFFHEQARCLTPTLASTESTGDLLIVSGLSTMDTVIKNSITRTRSGSAWSSSSGTTLTSNLSDSSAESRQFTHGVYGSGTGMQALIEALRLLVEQKALLDENLSLFEQELSRYINTNGCTVNLTKLFEYAQRISKMTLHFLISQTQSSKRAALVMDECRSIISELQQQAAGDTTQLANKLLFMFSGVARAVEACTEVTSLSYEQRKVCYSAVLSELSDLSLVARRKNEIETSPGSALLFLRGRYSAVATDAANHARRKGNRLERSPLALRFPVTIEQPSVQALDLNLSTPELQTDQPESQQPSEGQFTQTSTESSQCQMPHEHMPVPLQGTKEAKYAAKIARWRTLPLTMELENIRALLFKYESTLPHQQQLEKETRELVDAGVRNILALTTNDQNASDVCFDWLKRLKGAATSVNGTLPQQNVKCNGQNAERVHNTPKFVRGHSRALSKSIASIQRGKTILPTTTPQPCDVSIAVRSKSTMHVQDCITNKKRHHKSICNTEDMPLDSEREERQDLKKHVTDPVICMLFNELVEIVSSIWSFYLKYKQSNKNKGGMMSWNILSVKLNEEQHQKNNQKTSKQNLSKVKDATGQKAASKDRKALLDSGKKIRGEYDESELAAIKSASTPKPLVPSSVSIDDFEFVKPISSGAYGRVVLARGKKTGKLYAVKIQRKRDLIRKNMTNAAFAEKNIMSSLDHPFIVKLYYAFQSESNLYLVMEYCAGGDCASLLDNLGAFSLEMTRVYIAEIVLALEAIHATGIVHRDIKPENIVINSDGHLLLTDFGLSSIGAAQNESLNGSKIAPAMVHSPSFTSFFRGACKAASTSNTSNTATSVGAQTVGQSDSAKIRVCDAAVDALAAQGGKFRGTPDYLAPEILLGTGHGASVDWWALGAVCYEFLAGVPPFAAATPQEIFSRILAHRLEFPSQEDADFDDDARDFVQRLLDPNPESRLGTHGADEVKAHRFFMSIKWNSLVTEDRTNIFKPQCEDAVDTSYFTDRQNHGSLCFERVSKSNEGKAVCAEKEGEAVDGKRFDAFVYTSPEETQ